MRTHNGFYASETFRNSSKDLGGKKSAIADEPLSVTEHALLTLRHAPADWAALFRVMERGALGRTEAAGTANRGHYAWRYTWRRSSVHDPLSNPFLLFFIGTYRSKESGSSSCHPGQLRS